MVITAANENTSYATPSTSDLLSWDSYYSLGFPVVADPGRAVDKLYDPNAQTRPTYVLIEPGGKIVKIGSSITNSDIEAILPTAYP
jgi:hypothetical protein